MRIGHRAGDSMPLAIVRSGAGAEDLTDRKGAAVTGWASSMGRRLATRGRSGQYEGPTDGVGRSVGAVR
jgi:hypothetical protein